MKFKTLYKKDAKGNIRTWTISVDDNVNRTRTGTEGGVLRDTTRIFTKGKNIGKKNETTPAEQAYKDAESKWNKKLNREGWQLTKEDAENAIVTAPMLAQKLIKSSQIPKIAYIQPKLDGVRCLAFRTKNCVKMYSRQGKRFDGVLWDLARELKEIMSPGEIFDGELYHMDWDFQRIISAVKKESYDSFRLHYWVFDMPSVKHSFKKRNHAFNTHNKLNSYRVFKSPSFCVIEPTKKSIEQQCNSYIRRGYEGFIVRDSKGTYDWGKRSSNLLKYKGVFKDDEYRIIGYKRATGMHEGAIIFRCRVEKTISLGKSHRYVDVTPKFSIDKRKDMYGYGWRFVGEMLTVRYQKKSRDGLPIFPVGIAIRNYE